MLHIFLPDANHAPQAIADIGCGQKSWILTAESEWHILAFYK